MTPESVFFSLLVMITLQYLRLSVLKSKVRNLELDIIALKHEVTYLRRVKNENK